MFGKGKRADKQPVVIEIDGQTYLQSPNYTLEEIGRVGELLGDINEGDKKGGVEGGMQALTALKELSDIALNCVPEAVRATLSMPRLNEIIMKLSKAWK